MLKRIVDRLKGKAPAGAKRSAQWPRVRKEHLAKNPTCALCGGTKKLEVHHIQPFHVAPELELAASNLITLCEARRSVNCHLLGGHLLNYKLCNPNVVDDARVWLQKLQEARGGKGPSP